MHRLRDNLPVRHFLITIFVLCTLPSRAANDLWLKHYSAGEFERARELLLNMVRAEPRNALFWFNLGNTYLMLRQHTYAETSYLRVEKLKSPLAPAARLYRAKALAARQEFNQAKTLLNSVIAGVNTTSAIREEARRDLIALNSTDDTASAALTQYRNGNYAAALELIQQASALDDNLRLLKAMVLIKLEREEAAAELLQPLKTSNLTHVRGLARNLVRNLESAYSKAKWLFLEGAGGWSSNVDQNADGDSGTALNLLAGGGGRLWSKRFWYLSGGYSGRFEEIPGRSDLQSLGHELRLNAGREVKSSLILLSPHYNHDSWDNDPRRSSYGLDLRYRGGSVNFEHGLEVGFTQDQSLHSEQNYLAGTSQSYRIFAGWILFPVYFRIHALYQRQDIGDQIFTDGDVIPAAHRALGGGTTVLWRISPRWALDQSFTYATRDYKTLALPGNEHRRDRWVTGSVRALRIVTPSLSTYLSLSHGRNDSTLNSNSVSNENYTQTQMMAGGIWDAL